MYALQRVALTQDLPEHGLKAGDVMALASVYPNEIRPLETDEIASARRVKTILICTYRSLLDSPSVYELQRG